MMTRRDGVTGVPVAMVVDVPPPPDTWPELVDARRWMDMHPDAVTAAMRARADDPMHAGLRGTARAAWVVWGWGIRRQTELARVARERDERAERVAHRVKTAHGAVVARVAARTVADRAGDAPDAPTVAGGGDIMAARGLAERWSTTPQIVRRWCRATGVPMIDGRYAFGSVWADGARDGFDAWVAS